jgi:hypothetical protein
MGVASYTVIVLADAETECMPSTDGIVKISGQLGWPKMVSYYHGN